MERFAFSLLLFALLTSHTYAKDSTSVDEYATRALCLKSANYDSCWSVIHPLVSQGKLYVYARVLSSKNALIPDWAAYCKGGESPSLCMSIFESDYINFKSFVLSALTNEQLANKLSFCHKNIAIDSYVGTRNKQCIYQ